MDTHAQNNDLVVIEGFGSQEALFKHYSKRMDTEIKSTKYLGSSESMEPSVEAHDRVWRVRASLSNKRYRLDDSIYDQGHSPTDHKQYKHIDLTLYEQI